MKIATSILANKNNATQISIGFVAWESAITDAIKVSTKEIITASFDQTILPL